MLVVGGVELIFLHHAQQVGKLEESDHALRLEQAGEAGNEVIDVWHMGQHVVGHHQIGQLARLHQFIGQFHAKALDDVDTLPRAALAVLVVGSMP